METREGKGEILKMRLDRRPLIVRKLLRGMLAAKSVERLFCLLAVGEES